MISAVVLTGKEQDMIKACLESLKWVDEIIVISWNSDQETIELAKKYTNKILNYHGDSYAEARNLGMEKSTGDWVMYIDADERVLEDLKDEIKGVSQNSDKGAYAVSRKNIILGKFVDYGPYKHDWMIKLFKKDQFKTWVGKVHEHGEFSGELGYTKHSLLHLTHRDIDHIVLKSLEWSKIDADLRLSSHPKMSSWRFFRILITETFNQGISRRGFFGGTVGVIDAFLQVFSLFITYVRLWQFQQAKPLMKVYKDIDRNLIESNFKNYQ